MSDTTSSKRTSSVFSLLAGLLIGTALGGAAVSATLDGSNGGSTLDKEVIKQIVRETISEEPQLILDSVQKMQESKQKKDTEATTESLKDPKLKAEIYDSADSPFIGPANANKTVVEFFDYNCPACKMMFEGLDKLATNDKSVKIIFKEYPIFGPQSETNSKIGIAVHRIDDSKYFAFHTKMMSNKGRTDEKQALQYVKEIGMDPAKVKAEADSPEVAKILERERALGGKLKLSGTPTLIVDGEFVPHALTYDDLTAKLKAK